MAGNVERECTQCKAWSPVQEWAERETYVDGCIACDGWHDALVCPRCDALTDTCYVLLATRPQMSAPARPADDSERS